MLLLPGLDAVDGEKEIRILCGLRRAIDNADRRDEILHRNSVGRAVLVVASADPVHRRVEMGAGMLAELEPVPRPERTVLVVIRDGVNFDRRRVLADLRRQLDQRRIGTERRGQVHHLDGAGRQRRCKIAENLGTGHGCLRGAEWFLQVVCLAWPKPSANILDMKYLRWQATCAADHSASRGKAQAGANECFTTRS